MRRRRGAALLTLGAAVVAGLTGCTASPSTASLTVTFTDGAEQTIQEVSFSDLACRTSSVNRVFVSESTLSSGENEFLASAPTDGRDAYAISFWLGDYSFVSTAKFDASGSTVTFDALPGFVAESLNGERATSAGVEATLDGTITCN